MTMTLSPRRILASAGLALVLASPLAAQPYDYARADSVSRAAPAAAAESVESLGAYFRGALQTDRDRARAIYRWMTDNVAYDAELFFRGALFPPAQDAASVLRRRRGVCQGFSALYERVAEAAGLESVTVIGRAKALSRDRRRPFETQQHTWNAVRIDGEWALLDASWGAGDIVGSEFVRRPRDFYFDTPPEKMIWSHRADAGDFQMLDAPLSMREFERLPFTHRDFWELGWDAQMVFDAVRQPGFPGFAGIFTAPGHRVRIEQAPLVSHLAAGEAQTFRLHAPGADSVVVAGGAWQPLQRDGDVFSGTAALQGERMVVMISYPDLPQSVVVLEYANAADAGRRR
jgi:Transglutaminase-like superfamily